MSFTTEVRATTPFPGQKPGTSGLRKKVSEVSQPNYIENFVECVFKVLNETNSAQGSTLVVGGDGRYYNSVAIQAIVKIAAAHGVRRLWVGQNGILSTPAVSVIIRERQGGVASGGFILTASHNPGGPTEDFGIKYNTENGGPALEDFTDKIYNYSTAIQEYKIANLPDVDINNLGVHDFTVDGHEFTVEIIDSTEDYVRKLQEIFDFDAIRRLLGSGFRIVYDCMHGVAGPYVRRIFGDLLQVSQENLLNSETKEDFGGGHPDPNLVYAHDLVKAVGYGEPPGDYPDFGAANDGDADRNMILGKQFFVTPSDSVAVLAANATCIPYFASGLKGVARSMPTSAALDTVAKSLGVELNEVPTGWKFFGNLMDAGRLSICGEESFGTGSDHCREKDGVWAVLAWLSVLAHARQTQPDASVESIVRAHWATHGRNYYSRYDYENVDADKANQLMAQLAAKQADFQGRADNFSYTDPVDGSVTRNQGLRFITDEWRVIYRLSGTGSVGATVRVYYEKFDANQISLATEEALAELIQWSLEFSNIHSVLEREGPTVIT